MKTSCRKLTLLVAVLSTLCPQLPALAQGSLAPPGAPTPTMKSLQQVEPRTDVLTLGNSSGMFSITNSGSYYLSASVLESSGNNAITINADNVSLDLNGFSLVGTNGGFALGIQTLGNHTNIVIRNGIVTGWGGGGINALGARNVAVEHLVASLNGGVGINVGTFSRVDHCVVCGNLSRTSNKGAINTSESCIVSDCLVDGNNTSTGGHGIACGAHSLVEHCDVTANVSSNAFGILVGSYSTVIDCNVSGNGSFGVTVGGISAFASTTVRRCTVDRNSGDGISSSGDNLLLADNNCSENSGAGININGGSHIRVDDNSLSRNSTYGLLVSTVGGANLIIRNSAMNTLSSTNFSIAAGNVDALIVSFGSGFTSSGPWVNFSE